MEQLKEMVRVVTKNKVKQIQIVGQPAGREGRIHQLFAGIADEKYLSDADAIEDMYGGETSRASYNKLKFRLKNRLLNTIFFIDVTDESFTDLAKAYYSCYKDYAAVKILVGRFATKSAYDLAKRVLKKTIHYELTDLTVLLLRTILNYLVIKTEDFRRIDYYETLFDKYSKLLVKELEVEGLEKKMILLNQIPNLSDQERKQKSEKYERKIKKILRKYNSFQINRFGYRALAKKCEIENDYPQLLHTCQQAAEYFLHKTKLEHKVVISGFLYRIFVCHIQLKNYEEGERVALHCIDISEEETSNWFLFHAYLVVLYMHAEKLEKAYRVYLNCRFHSGFEKMPPRYREFWMILEAYLQYLILIGKIDPDKYQTAPQAFRLQRFLNNLPIFSRDKRNFNIPVLILQMLFLLQQQKYEQVNDRVKALEMYTSRYLKKGDTFRSNCFIKMLLQLPKNHFHRQRVIRKTQDLYKRLGQVPINVANQGSETEYIPYELLWQYILESLEDKLYYL